MIAVPLLAELAKRPNLDLKMGPKELLGYLPLAIALPELGQVKRHNSTLRIFLFRLGPGRARQNLNQKLRLSQERPLLQKGSEAKAGSTKANGKEPKSCLGQVFNFKLGCFVMCTIASPIQAQLSL
jgi:hypothetical protein